jgi:hypothetical protein
MDIILLLFFLQVKHWYADFKIQTYMQTVRKGIWLDLIGLSHTLDHVWTTLIALLVYSLFYSVTASVILTVAVVESILHYAIDYTKVKYGCKDNTKPLFWNQFGLDQLAHQVTYLGMVLYIVK